MTVQDFKYILSDSVYGSPTNQVMVLYNEYSSIFKLDAIAIRLDNTNQTQLQQATKITLILPQAGGLLEISLIDTIVPLYEVNKSQVENYYVYEFNPEGQRLQITQPVTGSLGFETYQTVVTIEPGEGDDRVINSDYNVVIGNAQNIRQSEYISECERFKQESIPSNLQAILSDTAQPANIQDSNYTDTGWINGRYQGSKLTTTTNLGTEPFLPGQFFEGALFPYDTDDTLIIGLGSQNAVEWQPLFSSGRYSIPRYYVQDLAFEFTDASEYLSMLTPYLSLITTTTTGYAKYDLDVGDLLKIKTNMGEPTPLPTPVYTEEVLQIRQPSMGYPGDVYPYEAYSPPFYDLFTKRKYEGTPMLNIQTFGGGFLSTLHRIEKQRIYNLSGNRVRSLYKGKLIVRGRDEVLYLDSFGNVIGGTEMVEI